MFQGCDQRPRGRAEPGETQPVDDTLRGIGRLIRRFRDMNLASRQIRGDSVLTNLRRMRYITFFSMSVSLAVLLFFTVFHASASPNELIWRAGILVCHTLLFLLMGVLGLAALHYRKQEKTSAGMYVVQYACIFVILVIGAVLSAVDQLVTSNITPFLIACTVSGIVFLLRPAAALTAYLGGLLVFFLVIRLFQKNPNILLSNRVNGIAAAVIGIGLSFMLWRSFHSNLMQKAQIVRQQQELAEKNRELINLAFYDPMTTLYNRRRFEELLAFEFAAVARSGRESSILILDIDRFKEINDQFGHPFGDLVLKQTARILKENTRRRDAVSRWGGEEFLILLPGTCLSDGKHTAEKLRRLIEDTTFQIDNRQVRITASFGVTTLKGDRENSLELFYKEVDQALYTAKENGRNRVETTKTT